MRDGLYASIYGSSSLNTAVFDCKMCTNWQMNVYVTSNVELNLVKFHSSTSMLTLHSAPTCSAI